MKVLVGLGNPGTQYLWTRHNAGFLILDLLAQELELQWVESKYGFLEARGSLWDEKIILVGCSNDNFYAVNYSDASLRFAIPNDGDVNTSASFKEGVNGVEMYFGSDDGNIYGVDIDGNFLNGFPYDIGGSVVGTIVFSDLNGDESLDLIAVNSLGQIFALNEFNELLDYFPISYQFPFTSPPMVVDYDLDGDFEIVSGSGGDLVLVDYKFQTQDLTN